MGEGKQARLALYQVTPSQPHMASVAEELAFLRAANVSRRSTLLIDDDARNVDLALRHGVNAVLCNPANPASIERGIESMLANGYSPVQARCY